MERGKEVPLIRLNKVLKYSFIYFFPYYFGYCDEKLFAANLESLNTLTKI